MPALRAYDRDCVVSPRSWNGAPPSASESYPAREVRASDIGAAGFIRKPVKNSVLLARVARALKEA